MDSKEIKTLGDRYEMGDPIGRGGMATIYRARDTRMGRMVAVKILREMYSSDPKFVLRFQREARAVSALSHPNIVQVYDYGRGGDEYYIVMELIEGTDLRRYLKVHGILDLRRATVIAHDVALALGAAHQRGIVHRDVKPQNILVNDQALVKLTDFGIATFYRDMDNERLTTTGMTLGTVQYYAPEQAQGEVVTPAADVYALGIVMYEMLVGHPPFDGDTPVAIAVRHIQEPPVRPSRFNPDIPPALERIIMRCLEKDPRDRYRDGDALAYALETYDKPRNSSGRMDTPGVSPRPGSAPINNNGRLSRPRPSVGYGDEGGFAPNNYSMNTRADVPAGTMPRPGVGGGYPPDSAPDEEKTSPVAAVTTAVIVASVLLLLAVGCFLAFKVGLLGNNSTSTASTQQGIVPYFVGMTIDQAQAAASAAHFPPLKVTIVQNDTIPKNQVLDQNPSTGTPYPITSIINVSVSAGPGNVVVPDVSTLFPPAACAKLLTVQLKCNGAPFPDSSSTLPQGEVSRTDPQAGASVNPNTPGLFIQLYVSQGVPTATPTLVTTVTPSPTVGGPTATPTVGGPTATPTVGGPTATPTVGGPTATPTVGPPTATPTRPPCPSPTVATPIGGCH